MQHKPSSTKLQSLPITAGSPPWPTGGRFLCCANAPDLKKLPVIPIPQQQHKAPEKVWLPRKSNSTELGCLPILRAATRFHQIRKSIRNDFKGCQARVSLNGNFFKSGKMDGSFGRKDRPLQRKKPRNSSPIQRLRFQTNRCSGDMNIRTINIHRYAALSENRHRHLLI